jgi:hypothetical protein
MEHPIALQHALRSVEEPVLKFIETGLFDDNWFSLPEEMRASKASVALVQTRRIARKVAKELKRPFILASEVVATNYWDPMQRRWVTNTRPEWRHAYMEIPKRKYLIPIASPLLLVAGAANSPVGNMSRDNSSIWRFTIQDRGFWNEYRAALDRPEMREARKLPPLEAAA